MLQALGFRFMDSHNNEVGYGEEVLSNIYKIDTNHANIALRDCTFKLACDVNNVLYGPEGAVYVFGPQKGATESTVKDLDDGLKHFAQVVLGDLGKDIHNIKGAGAAGGLGAAFSGFLGAQLQSGIGLILDVIGMDDHIKDADLVITGEGKLDSQTAMGKVPVGVANMARKNNVSVIALAGAVTEDASILNELGITSYFSIMTIPMTADEAMDSKITYNNYD